MDMKKNQPFEREKHDLTGNASVDLLHTDDFDSFALKLTGFNKDRFSPVALRMYMHRQKPVVTLYALDKTKKKERGRFQARKFKLRMGIDEMIKLINGFDFTVSNGSYDLSKMHVGK